VEGGAEAIRRPYSTPPLNPLPPRIGHRRGGEPPPAPKCCVYRDKLITNLGDQKSGEESKKKILLANDGTEFLAVQTFSKVSGHMPVYYFYFFDVLGIL